MAITYMDRLLVSSLLGTATLGVYMVAIQIGMVMVALIEPLNKALAPWLFKHLASNEDGVRRMIVRRTYELGIVLLLCGFLLAIAANLAFDRLVGAQFSGARGLIPWMIAGYVAQGMYYMVVNYLFYAERTGTLAAITGSAAILGCVISYVLIATIGVTGAGAAFLLNNVILLLLVWLGAARIVPMPWTTWRRHDIS
jgi:O-antigen/teichoic acid export membrane protein